VAKPIQNALKDANITLEQLDSVILHGGSVRVPFVQKALEDAVGSNKIAKTVNADEAAVMGITTTTRNTSNIRRNIPWSSIE